MGRSESLDEVLEEKISTNRRVENAFHSLPEYSWEPLNRKPHKFIVAVMLENELEAKVAVRYEIRDVSQTNVTEPSNFFSLRSDIYNYSGNNDSLSGVYISIGEEHTSVFLSKKTGEVYRNVAAVNYMENSVVFDRNALDIMSDKELRKFTYAVNQYLNRYIFFF